jgi:hypothetical protein
MRKSKRTAAESSDIGATAPKARAIAWLRDHASPRLAMSLMLASSIGCGFLSSIAMHRMGVGSPLIRYPLVVVVGWTVFLFLVGVWVWWYRRESAQHVDTRDIGNQQPIYWSDIANGEASVASTTSTRSGRNLVAATAAETVAESRQGSDAGVQQLASGAATVPSRRSSSGNWNVNLDGDDAGFIFLLLAVLAVALAVLGVVIFAVYSAPSFFAELLIDGGVGTWLYKHIGVAPSTDALTIAIKRSLWPVAILVAMFIALATAMHHVDPHATTLGQAWQAVRANR